MARSIYAPGVPVSTAGAAPVPWRRKKTAREAAKAQPAPGGGAFGSYGAMGPQVGQAGGESIA